MFFSLITQPLFNFLILLYNLVGDFGVAIIIFTVILKFALFPLIKKQQQFQEKQKIISPKIKEIQQKYKNDPKKLQQEQFNLMKEHQFNPASGCLPIIIQMIIFITFYWILRPGNVLFMENGSFTVSSDALYSFVNNPEEINKTSLGIIDLTKSNTVLAFLTGIVQFIHSRMLTQSAASKKKDENKGKKKDSKEPDIQDMLSQQMKVMNYIFPILIIYIGLTLSAGLPLYWITSSAVSIFQHKFLQKKLENEK
ncbi:MAG: membrane protein insertase YidC [Candidatus Moranbacteria bacterium]|nr:membrane protein insertase YidC [Candidatus Moranbacteria bacterium]